jgi:hypothetical protein
MQLVIQHVENAPLGLVTQLKVLRHAMQSLLDLTVGTVKFVNVKQVIIALVKLPIKLLVILGRTPRKQDRLYALNVHPAHLPTQLAPFIVKTAMMIPTSRNPMLRNAFQCKKGTTNPARQPKLNARRGKQELVVMKRVKSVKLDRIKT